MRTVTGELIFLLSFDTRLLSGIHCYDAMTVKKAESSAIFSQKNTEFEQMLDYR